MQQTRNCVSLSLFLRLPSLSHPGNSRRADDGKDESQYRDKEDPASGKDGEKTGPPALRTKDKTTARTHTQSQSQGFHKPGPRDKVATKATPGPGPPSQPPHPGAANPKNATEDRTASTNTQVSPFSLSLFPIPPQTLLLPPLPLYSLNHPPLLASPSTHPHHPLSPPSTTHPPPPIPLTTSFPPHSQASSMLYILTTLHPLLTSCHPQLSSPFLHLCLPSPPALPHSCHSTLPHSCHSTHLLHLPLCGGPSSHLHSI